MLQQGLKCEVANGWGHAVAAKVHLRATAVSELLDMRQELGGSCLVICDYCGDIDTQRLVRAKRGRRMSCALLRQICLTLVNTNQQQLLVAAQ